MFQVVPFLFRPIMWLVTFVWILVKFMTQLFFTKPLQSHRHHQWLDKKCGKPCGTVATSYYFSPLLLAKLATQNEAVTFSSIANIFNYLANRNLFKMCEKKKKKNQKIVPWSGSSQHKQQHHCPHLWFVPASFFAISLLWHYGRHHCLQTLLWLFKIITNDTTESFVSRTNGLLVGTFIEIAKVTSAWVLPLNPN